MGILSFHQRKLPIETQKIEAAIQHLEQHSSAEIRVVVEYQAKISQSKTDTPAITRATQLFDALKMYETPESNAVLIYLAFKPHYIAIIGDTGIHQYVGDNFWNAIYRVMKTLCQTGHYTEAICKAIQLIEVEFIRYFPIQPNDKNELANEVIIK